MSTLAKSTGARLLRKLGLGAVLAASAANLAGCGDIENFLGMKPFARFQYSFITVLDNASNSAIRGKTFIADSTTNGAIDVAEKTSNPQIEAAAENIVQMEIVDEDVNTLIHKYGNPDPKAVEIIWAAAHKIKAESPWCEEGSFEKDTSVEKINDVKGCTNSIIKEAQSKDLGLLRSQGVDAIPTIQRDLADVLQFQKTVNATLDTYTP